MKLSLRWLAFGLITLCAFNTKAAKETLAGVVISPAGKPISGATVFIYMAMPKQGPADICPSCYSDCRKKATVGVDGTFKIADLDPDLLFRVLIVAPGCQPKFIAKVDPAATNLTVKLKAAAPGDSAKKRLRGRVVDAKGHIVPRAVISIRGVTRPGVGTQFGGNDQDVDPEAVTDDHGEFVINCRIPIDDIGVDVNAPGLAEGIFQGFATGDQIHEIKLTTGVSIKGRLLKDGKPIPHVEIAAGSVERRCESYVDEKSVETGHDGRFLLSNLPPHVEYNVYATMKSAHRFGALSSRRVQAEDDDSVVDLGDMELKFGHFLEGQIKLSDGKPVPAKTHVFLSRADDSDDWSVAVDKQGRFWFDNIPAETVEISTQVKGYRYSVRNASLDTLNPYHLTGRVDSNKNDLVILLDPGSPLQSTGVQAELEDKPLRGAEENRGPGNVKITGTVTDAETGKPLPLFTVTRGVKNRFPPDINWVNSWRTTGFNGRLELNFIPSGPGEALQITADGYLPKATDIIPPPGTNLVIALVKGAGPSGTVLDPDGKLAAGIDVYLTDVQNGVYIGDPSMSVRDDVYRQTQRMKTDALGRFSFAAGIGDFSVVVSMPAGFAQIGVDDLRKTREVRLQPWARVEGTLMVGSHPGMNATVHLTADNSPYLWYPRRFNPLSVFLETTTDARGHFVFEKAPPQDLTLYYSPPVRNGRGPGVIAQSQEIRLTLHPGENARVVMGGKGRPVIGKFVVNGYDGQINWRADVHSINTVVQSPPSMPTYDSYREKREKIYEAAKSETEKEAARIEADNVQATYEAAMRDFYSSQAGRAYSQAQKRYAINFSSNGAFRVEDIPGGKYAFAIDLREGEGGVFNNTPRVASCHREFVVPDSPGGRTDEPYDVGVIELQAATLLRKGKLAPDLSVKTIDGKPVRLSDYKGKFVLVDFWATWCGPCCGETPNLKETFAAFKNDPRFAMIGLSLDEKPDAPRDYAKKNDVAWTMGFLGKWANTDIPNQWGVEGIPAIFLIGPDGKVIAKDLRGPNIKSAVIAALATAN